MSIQISTLPNGLRILTDRVAEVESVAVGVWVDVGTRYEELAHNGIAHMVEHMMFKGTPTRTAVRIAEQIEDVGGQMNAYTSREITSYHMHMLKDDLPLALDVLADIIQRPIMPDIEVERERHVILQEIGMTLDTPDDWVFDLYQETAYPHQTLGAPILGRAPIIRNMKRDTLMQYVSHFYTPSRLVIGVAGNAEHDKVVQMAGELFCALPENGPAGMPPAKYTGGDVREEKELEQSHVILGFRGMSRRAKDYYAAVLLSIVLGGGMSSRLFQEIREKRGLVYSVFSHHVPYQDDGQFVIYAGTGPEHLPELMPVLCEEINNIRAPVAAEELKRAKAQIRAEILMGQESMMRRANQQAKNLIHFEKPLDLHEKIAAIEAVTLQDLSAAAEKIFSTTPTLAGLGPLKKLESYDAVRKRMAA